MTTKMISTQLPDAMFTSLEQCAKNLDCSKSWIVRQAIADWLAQNIGEANKRKKKEQTNDWDKLFAMIEEAHQNGEDMNFEPPVRENIWKNNPLLQDIDK